MWSALNIMRGSGLETQGMSVLQTNAAIQQTPVVFHYHAELTDGTYIWFKTPRGEVDRKTLYLFLV